METEDEKLVTYMDLCLFVYEHLRHQDPEATRYIDLHGFALDWDASVNFDQLCHAQSAVTAMQIENPHKVIPFVKSIRRKFARFHQRFEAQEKLFQRKILTD